MLVSKLVNREAMQKAILGQISLQFPSRLETALLDNKDIFKLKSKAFALTLPSFQKFGVLSRTFLVHLLKDHIQFNSK